jgi:tripartite-type tricarboxylate transporter receptor subunit TctC
LQIATEKHRAIPDTPLITDLATSPSQKMVLDVAVAPQTMARPFVSPPDIPAARLKALQEAFDRTMKDPDFLADAERMKLDVNPVTGAEIAEIVKKLYAAPKEVLQQASAYMGAK